MILLAGLRGGFRQLWDHKVRSAMSIACVALGVASFVIVSGLIAGMFTGWKAAISQSGGLEKVAIMDAPLPKSQRHLAGARRGRTFEDLQALREMGTFADTVSPEIDLVPAVLSRNGKTFVGRVQGVETAILAINNFTVERGRFFGDYDQAHKLPVIVLGTAPARALFGEKGDPLGKTVTLNGRAFVVVGVLQHYSKQQFGYDVLARKNEIAFIPVTTMGTLFQPGGRLTWLNVRARSTADLPRLVDQARNILVGTHRGLRDVRFQTREEDFARFESTRGGWLFAGAAVALVSLLIGGISIMNLMLASIQERIREIGVRKAVGAWDRDIFLLFLAEAVTLSVLGGVFGVVAGRLVLDVIAAAAPQISSPTFSAADALLGLLFSFATGVFAGVYPALEAARLDPIEALRAE